MIGGMKNLNQVAGPIAKAACADAKSGIETEEEDEDNEENIQRKPRLTTFKEAM